MSSIRLQRSPELQTRCEGGVSWKYLPVALERHSAARDFQTHVLPLVRPAWKQRVVRTKVFTEGITNLLYGFYAEGEREDLVLLRINGEGTDKFIDREREIVAMLALHRAGLTPPVYLQFLNGLCYGYVPGRTFTVDDMQDEKMIQRTARALARLHAVPVPDSSQGLQPQLWKAIFQFMDYISGISGEYKELNKTKKFQEIFGTLQEEVDALYLELRQSHSPLVFCHNDLLCGNLIYDSNTGKVSMVDFEYSGANCAAYDIGNHFCEFAGITDPVDYDRYPCRAVQYKWIRCYLQESYRLQGRESEDVNDADIRELYREVNKYALAAHLFWATWALIQAEFSTIDFDYIEYADVRVKEYKKRKEEFLNL